MCFQSVTTNFSSWFSFVKTATPGKVLRWTGVLFVICLEILILIGLSVWLAQSF